MSSQTSSRGKHALLPFQQHFVDEFTRPESDAKHLLVAPPGSGKTHIATEVLRALHDAGSLEHALVLCPASLVAQYAHILTDQSEAPNVQVVDRYRYRELEASTPVGKAPWPQTITAVMSLDLARQPDVAEGLVTTKWQLVIVDEAHRLTGQRAALIRRLVDSGSVSRLLLMTATPSGEPVLPDLTVTEWTTADLLQAKHARPNLRIRVVEVPYTSAETAALRAVDDLAARLGSMGAITLAQVIKQQAQSSLYALEQSLLTMRNRVAHGSAPSAQDVETDDDAFLGFERWEPQFVGVLPDVERVLLTVDAIGRDSKLETLHATISAKELTGGRKAVLLLSRYAGTVEYLTSALSDRGLDVVGLTGSTPAAERIAAMESVSEGSRIGVLTLAAFEAYEIGTASVYLFYEQPSEKELEQHVARIWWEGRRDPFDVVYFSATAPRDSEEE